MKRKSWLKYQLFLIPTNRLLRHEKIDKKVSSALLSKIKKDGIWKAPLSVDRKSKLVIDGHQRLHVAKLLKLKRVPVFFCDYFSSKIIPSFFRAEYKGISKKDIIKKAKSGYLFPPKTTRHLCRIGKSFVPIRKCFPKTNIPLEKLK
jgi:hypothetical protein